MSSSGADARPRPARRWIAWLAIAVLAALLRGLYPTADPPWRATVGVVWHDEGAWTHNARNRALWGTWRTDDWNPLYVAPVFTGLEYAAFAALGVGTWQARLVPMTLGVIAVDRARLRRGADRRTAGRHRRRGPPRHQLRRRDVRPRRDHGRPDGGGHRRQLVGVRQGAGAPGLGRCRRRRGHRGLLHQGGGGVLRRRHRPHGARGHRAARVCRRSDRRSAARAAGLWTLAGLAVAGVVALALFVGPEWSEYRFYNWQMSVTRKPSYDAQSLLNRMPWFSVLHDVLSRMWVVVALGLAAFVARALDWFRRPPAEQLLVLWVGVGVVELLLHDVGNERRFVFLIPAFTALAALAIASDRAIVPDWLAPLRGWRRLLFVPLALYAAYVVSGSLVRLAFLYDVRPAVRGGAALALVAVAAAWILRRPLTAAARRPWTPTAAVIVVAILAAGGAGQFVQFAAGRSYENVEASRELGRACRRARGPRQAGQRTGAREPHPADLRGPAVRQLRGSPHAERCTMVVDLRGAADGLRGPGHPRRPRRLSRTPDGLDLRRGRNHVGPGSRGPHRQGPARRPGHTGTGEPSSVRRIDSAAIKAHADLRFRSEYDYALFEYFRSAKVFAFLDHSGVRLEGRVLDRGAAAAGCRCRSPRRPPRSSPSI